MAHHVRWARGLIHGIACPSFSPIVLILQYTSESLSASLSIADLIHLFQSSHYSFVLTNNRVSSIPVSSIQGFVSDFCTCSDTLYYSLLICLRCIVYSVAATVMIA